MKTNAPGKFDCEVYLKAWQLEMRDDYVMSHIDVCPWCGPLVNGDGQEFLLSVEEEATQRLAARARKRRRRFLKYSAAAVVGMTAVGFGIKAFWTPSSVEELVQVTFKSLDVRYKVTGEDGMRKHFKTGTEQEAMKLLDWIAEREQRNLYDIPVAAASDSRFEVKALGIRALQRIDPADLVDYLDDLRAAQQSEPDRRVQRLLRTIVTAVENS